MVVRYIDLFYLPNIVGTCVAGDKMSLVFFFAGKNVTSCSTSLVWCEIEIIE
jgi:hypothetical protein